VEPGRSQAVPRPVSTTAGHRPTRRESIQAYNLARSSARGLKAERIGSTPDVRLAETLAATNARDQRVDQRAAGPEAGNRRGDRMHASRATGLERVYQQRIRQNMRLHPRKEAGSSSTSSQRARRTPERSFSATRCSTTNFIARARASACRRPPLTARARRRLLRRRGSSRSHRTSAGASPSSSASGSASTALPRRGRAGATGDDPGADPLRARRRSCRS